MFKLGNPCNPCCNDCNHHDIRVLVTCCGTRFDGATIHVTDEDGAVLPIVSHEAETGASVYRAMHVGTYTILVTAPVLCHLAETRTVEVERIDCLATEITIDSPMGPDAGIFLVVGNGGSPGGVPGAIVTELMSGVSAVTGQEQTGGFTSGSPALADYQGVARLSWPEPPCLFTFHVEPPGSPPGFLAADYPSYLHPYLDPRCGPIAADPDDVSVACGDFRIDNPFTTDLSVRRGFIASVRLAVDPVHFHYGGCWWPIPRTLYYSDDFGSATLTPDDDGMQLGFGDDPTWPCYSPIPGGQGWYSGYYSFIPTSGARSRTDPACVPDHAEQAQIGIQAAWFWDPGTFNSYWVVRKSYHCCNASGGDYILTGLFNGAGPYAVTSISAAIGCLTYAPVSAFGGFDLCRDPATGLPANPGQPVPDSILGDWNLTQ